MPLRKASNHLTGSLPVRGKSASRKSLFRVRMQIENANYLFPRAMKMSITAPIQQQQEKEASSQFITVQDHLLFCPGYSLQYPFEYTGHLAEEQRLQGKFLLLGMLFLKLSYQSGTNTVK